MPIIRLRSVLNGGGWLTGSLLLLALTTMAEAQLVPGGSPRSRGFGGGAETLGDDPLGVVDNPAALGRPQPFAARMELGFGFLPEADPDAEEWTWDADNLTNSVWLRFGYLPRRDPDLPFHWAVWVNSASSAFATRGIIDAKEEPFRIDAESAYREIGASAGMELCRGLHVGLGLGIGVLLTSGDATPMVSPDSESEDLKRCALAPIPSWRLAVEWFPLSVLAVGLILNDGPYFLTDPDPDGEPIADVSAYALGGRPPTRLRLSATLEIAPPLHVTMGFELQFPHPPSMAADPVSDSISQLTGGIEVITPLDPIDFAQLALRGGVFASNVGDGFWNADAPIYEQLATGATAGAGLKLGRFTADVSLAITLFSNDVQVPLGQLAVAVGWFL